MRFGLHIGPFWVSQRLGRTQAQKRAAAKAAAERRQARLSAKQHQEWVQEWFDPAAVAAELAAQADRDSLAYRAVISGCHIDGLKGGSFTIEAEGKDTVTFTVPGNAALHLSLRNGDIIQVTLNPGKTGLEEILHLRRANGAKPRSPVNLTATDMEWHGFTVEAETHPPT